MSTIANAYVQIIPSADGITGSLTKALGGEADAAGKSAGASMASKIKGMLVKAGIGAAVGKVLKSSIDAGGALQQSFGGLETIYGDAADAAKNYAYEAAKAGISANDYAEQAVSFGASLKQAFGGDTTKAVEAANTAIMDMTDNAAKMGTPIESIQNAYQGFAKSNYTMLDNLKLGYGGTKEEMQRLLADAQKLSGVEYDISNLGDVYDAIHVIQEDLGLTGVAAQEASETFSGSFGAMKAAASNVLANMSLGKDIQGPLNQLSASVFTFVTKNFIPMLGNALRGLPALFQSAVGMAVRLISHYAKNTGGIITAGIEIIGGLAEGIAAGIPQLAYSALEIIAGLGNYLISGDWVTTIQTVVSNIWNALQFGIAESFGQGENPFDGMLEAFTNIDWAGAANTVLGLLGDAIALGAEVIPQVLQSIGLAAINLFQSIDWLTLGQTVINLISGGIKILAANIPTYLQNIGKVAMTLFRAINWIQLGRTVITLIKSGISALFSAIPTLLKSIGQGAVNFFKAINWREVGRTVINLIKMGLNALRTAIPMALKAIGTSAMSGFKSINWASVGWAVVNGIKSGISSLAGSLVESVKSLGARALSGIKGILGIASPSKVFADEVGANMALGIKEGWEKNLPVDDMISGTKRMTSDLSSAASFSASGTVTASTSGDKLDAILQLLGYYFPVLADRDVVLDSDKLVGALAPGINRKLGMITGW